MIDDQRFKNLMYEVSYTNRLLAEFISLLQQTGHIPNEMADAMLRSREASRKRLKQLEPKDK